MKKIMFNDEHGLTQAVLEGRKTMTRRIMKPQPTWVSGDGKIFNDSEPPKYKVGEVVAVAQSYKDAGVEFDEILDDELNTTNGWNNKMFVSAYNMPHHIRITNVRVERLQDISDEDCIREGIEEDHPYYWVPVNRSFPDWRKTLEGVSDMYSNQRDGKVYPHFWDSPQKAFAALIDKVSGKGTWESNPYVFAYEFELIK